MERKVELVSNCAKCGHEGEKHYGSEDLQCNWPGCPCLKWLVPVKAEEPAVVVEKPVMKYMKVEESEPVVKRGRGRPRKDGLA